MCAHRHTHKNNMSPSKFPLTCKMKGKHQIQRTTHLPLPQGPTSCWEEKKRGGTMLRHHHQVDRGWSCVIWLLQKRLQSQQASWSV